ncbi:hypothetical protein ANANG_G00199740 [Anguilla anguilla]|uniref:Metallo-beta-lactamase domain-containing protein n=1 Tax=Anguilla anguilla TaxID=7936 RepID=A0A9D3M406_ANGAN|nr:hypothetical protein ANANG_G00199740 [Anguilla anguilla]
MTMDLTFLGTGSAYPSPHRGASALVLRTEGDCWLFDCGEGTQTQLMKSQLKASRITKVFITHLHGDHLFGLPGLLCTVSLNLSPAQPPACVDIYGPRGLRHFLRVALSLSGSQLLFPYAVHELEPTADQCPPEPAGRRAGLLRRREPAPAGAPGRTIPLDAARDRYALLEDERFVVEAFRLFHRLPSFGFAVQERDRPGRLNTQLLRDLGVKPGPVYGRLKGGEAVTLESGRVLTPEEVLEEAVPGRKATLADGHRERAVEHGHSTPAMAAAVARACQARKLVLYHFSQRYRPLSLRAEGDGDGDDDDVVELRRQAEEALRDAGTEVVLADDFLTIPIPIKRLR